ncbi:MAG TPA: ECF-type sigma factor [Lacipirellulaceae bacterium]|jgi:RNA polymerase sigma factor (TIGR02999 family)|nr:ECF-type sigma factor [Lacipirellulaceae bacterium]
MTELTNILAEMDADDPTASERLLPIVYDELRRLAAARLAQEKPGQTLQPTALVHEAYLRLVNREESQHWSGRGHFFGAAAEAMRRILIENARRRSRIKHGGELKRAQLSPEEVGRVDKAQELLDLNDALERLAEEDSQSAELVKLRYFAGLTIPQAAEILGVSPRKANFLWSFARAWLKREMGGL